MDVQYSDPTFSFQKHALSPKLSSNWVSNATTVSEFWVSILQNGFWLIWVQFLLGELQPGSTRPTLLKLASSSPKIAEQTFLLWRMKNNWRKSSPLKINCRVTKLCCQGIVVLRVSRRLLTRRARDRIPSPTFFCGTNDLDARSKNELETEKGTPADDH